MMRSPKIILYSALVLVSGILAMTAAQAQGTTSASFLSGVYDETLRAACPFELYRAYPATGQVTPFGDLPEGSILEAQWSPDGSAVAFTLDPASGCGPGLTPSTLYVMQADGSNLRALVTDAPMGRLAWSPDNVHLAFMRYATVTEESAGDLVVLDTSSGAVAGQYEASAFHWSPDGTQLAFTRLQPDDALFTDLYAADLASGEARQLTDKPGNINSFAWNPDGQSVAFSYYELPNNQVVEDLYSVDVTSGTEQQITTTGQGPNYFSYSPDGTHIAYEGIRGEVGVMSADGSNLQIVSDGLQQGYRGLVPAWSPDSQQFAFEAPTTNSNRSYNIYTLHLYDIATGAVSIPDPNVETESRFAWSPDGKSVLFSARPAENTVSDIFVAQADGSSVTNLTDSPERFDILPAWQP